MPERIPQSVTKRVALKAYLSADGISPATGKTIAVVISKNGGSFGNPSAGATNATEIANGWYYVELSTTDTGTTGPLIVRGTATGVDDVEVTYEVALATNAGFSALPNAAAEASGGLGTLDAAQGSGGAAPANVRKYGGTAGTFSSGRPEVNTSHVGGTLQTAGDLAALLATIASYVDTEVSSLVTAVAALPSASANATALLDLADAIEVGLTVRNSLRLQSAALAGKLAGAGGTSVTIRNAIADSKDRITATVDSSGNRTAITTDLT